MRPRRRRAVSEPTADVVSPTLGMLGPERVTITDYKSSDVRDPAKARAARARLAPAPDLRDGLRGDDRAPARCGRAPLPRVGARRLGAVDPKRLAKAREQIAQAAAGMRARDYTPRPDYLACTYCAFRDICPASVAR